MVQRYEGMVNNQLNTAQKEIQSDYQMIQNLNYQELTSSYSAELLLSMINKLSSKVIGIHKIRTDLAEVEFPFVVQHSFIFDKAEIFYYQSIMQDLNRIRNNEMVIQVSKEQIRQCVEELKWKINVERASRLNESQEVQQNMELMKFFEGVRSYQNWQENIKRQTFTRLKERSHAIQNELSFKKGFILSKLQRRIDEIQKNNLKQIFKINYHLAKFERIIHILHKIRQCRKKQFFDHLCMKTKQISANQKISQMFVRYLPKRLVVDIRKISFQIKARKQRAHNLISKIISHKKKIQFVFKHAALKKLTISPMIKASKYTSAIKLITHVCQRYFVKTAIKKLNIPTKTIFYRLNEKYFTKLRQSFNELKENDIQIRLERPIISYRIKGKIIASLNKHEKQSINLKQTFSKWYLNTHQQKYAKKVYNIWLQGNTNKFTFFMRLKNMVNQMNKQKVSKQLKHFVKVTCDKYHKYEQYNKKYMLKKWIEQTRRLRKIENMFKLLLNITNQTVTSFKKTSIQKIIEFCKRKHIIKQYCIRYMLQHIENVKIAVVKWRKINNIKKEWGRKKLRILLLKNTEQFIKNKKEVLDILKKHWIQGNEKKINMTRKAISKDIVFLQRFMQIWRHNLNNTKAQHNISQKQVNSYKSASIIGISHTFKRVKMFELRKTINKFAYKRLQRLRRQNNLKNNFIKVVENNQKNLKQQSFNIFISDFKFGKLKKDQLVSKLVCANVVKQKLGLLIFRSKAHELTQLLKRQKSTKFFRLLQNKLKQNYIIFNRKLLVARILQKIVNSHQQNINTAFKSWKSMPMRIRWKLRSKIIKLHQRLTFLMNQRLALCHDSFKSSIISAKLKQKKVMYIMACKYEMVLKKYFNIYYKNASIQKEDDKIIHVTRLFQVIVQQQNKNFKIILQNPPVWPKKAAYIERLNQYLKRRMENYFQAWHKNIRALKYFNSIKDEKKKRCLQMFAKVMAFVKTRQSKEMVISFHKNYKLRKAKMHILKKICDSQTVKILKGFSAWKNLPSVTNKIKIQKAANFQSNLIYLIKRNMKITLNSMKDCKETGKEKKTQLVRSLVSNISGRVQTLFNKWRQNKNIKIVLDKQNKVENIFNILIKKTKPSFDLLIFGDQRQKKVKSLQIVQDYWNKQQKYYIKRWYKNIINMNMKDLSKKHYLINLSKIKTNHSSTRLVEQVVQKFKRNREDKLKQKYVNRRNHIIRMIENYEGHKRLLLNMTMDRLKFLHIKGNFHKNRAFHRFLTQKIKQVHANLEIWNKLAQQAKQVHKQKMVSQNFDHVQQLAKMNFYLIFARTKDTTIKKNTLDRLFKATELKRKGCFDLWRQNVKALKMMGQMDKQAKATILQRINKIVQSTSTQSVLKAIKKFSLNYKIEKIQRKFVQKLLNTKSGKIITAFKTWRTIPAANTVGKYKNYQKFFFKFQAFYKSRLKFAQSVFIETGDEGNLMKKQSIMKLFEMTSLGIRRYYNRWTRLTKEKHILMSVNRALKAFESGQEAIVNQYQIIFQDQRAYKIKINAIQRLIKASQGTNQNYFNKWRQNVRQFNIAQGMDAQKKKIALAMFDKVMGSSKTSQVLRVIELFQKNLKVVKVAKNFFNRLMNTKAGKVMSFFDKLKTIPDAKMNKLKKKGIIFENRLHNFVQKRLRNTLTPLKENIFEANSKKKYCLSRLLRACMGQNQKKFQIWRNVNREAKMLAHTSLFEKMFNNIENIYKGNFQITIKDAGIQIQKKKNVCRKLLNNSLFVQHHAYMIWKEAYHVDDINTKSRQHQYTNHLKNWIGVFNNHENKKIIQVIGVFRKLLEMRHFQQYEYYKSYKNRRCLNFFNNLKKIDLSYKFVFISALKTNHAEYILAQKSKILHSIFQAIQNATKTNMNQILRTQNQTALLNKTFERLCNNKILNLSKVFNIWRQNKKALNYKADVRRQKKKQMLKILNSQLFKEKNNKIIKILHKFSQNAKICSIKKCLLLRILKNKSDKVPTLFNSWKNVPYQQAKKLKNKATKFQSGLLKFMKNYLREVNDCFKRCRYEGINKKEEAARTIVRSKLIDINQLFFKWRKLNNENKITVKILTLDKTLTHLSTIFKDSFTIFDDCKRQDQKKVRGATNLFYNNVKKLNGYLNIWRRNSKIIILHNFQRLMRNFNPQDYNKRLMRIGFLMIVKRQQMEVLKGYINSLWKWKLSNIQASYYTKFINVFKESQQMIRLSNLINKKIYQNTHHSFRNILSVGHARTNRKRQIVEKYLTRKARNYFLIFKNNTLKSEINIWKSKYTESIKFKIFSDVLTSIFLKTKYSANAILAKNHNFTKKIDSLSNIVEMCQRFKLKDAFHKIKFDGQTQLLMIIDNLYESIRKANLQEAFDALNYNRKIYRLKNIPKIVSKYMKFIVFSKINRKKQRVIKVKLSINLLETLIKQHYIDNIKRIIIKFNKNRLKRLGAERLFRYTNTKYESYTKSLVQGCKNIQNISKLLERFRRGQMIQKILEKQDEMLKKSYLNKMRKKQNKWMELAIKKFATRASLISCPSAITFWRLKTYVSNI